jgi:hypothetical protein
MITDILKNSEHLLRDKSSTLLASSLVGSSDGLRSD